MKGALIIIGTFFAGLIIVALIAISTFAGMYNGLVTKQAALQKERANIEAQLQRRADLVPGVVSATKGAMKQEQAVFSSISKAYASFQNAPSGSQEKLDTGASLGNALRGYLVVVQQYPNLRSLDIITNLTVTLEGTENRISVARQRYNDSVEEYNKTRKSFPTSFIANMFGFESEKSFEADSDSKKAVKFEL